MPQCKNNNESMILLLYVSVGSGALITFVLNIFYAWKWHFKLDSNFRNQLIPRLCSVLITLMTFERAFRCVEVYLWYHAPLWVTTLCYNINNVISVTGLFYTICTILSIKLKSSFQGSVFELTEEEITLLSRLKTTLVLLLNLFFILNGIQSISYTLIGQLSLLCLAMFILMIGLTFLFKVDSGFVKRMHQLVAKHTAVCHPSAISPDSGYAQSPSLNVLQLPPNQYSNSPVSEEHSRQVSSMEIGEIAKKTTLSGLKKASVSDYEENDQVILKAAAKNLVLAAWINLSVLFIFIAGCLFGFYECHDYGTIVGHFFLALAFPINAVSITFHLPHSRREYMLFCSKFEGCFQKFVSWQTTRLLFLELTHQKEVTVNHSEIRSKHTSQ